MLKIAKRLQEIRMQRNLSMQQVADIVGTTKSQIDKLEKGERRLTVEWLLKISKALGCPPHDVLIEENLPHPGSTKSSPVPYEPKAQYIPVLGISDSFSSTIRNMGHVSGSTPCPPQLSGVKDAYAVCVPGEEMAPRFHAGEIVYLNPLRAMLRDCYLLLTLKPMQPNDEESRGYIRQFIRFTQSEIHVCVPGKDPEIHRKENIKHIARVVGMFED